MAVYGRLPVYTGTILLATLFEIGCALAPNLPGLIVLRLFAGFFSAAPLSNAGGSLNDIGNPVFRTLGLPLFTTTGFVGPILGPIIGSYIAESHLGWRWCYWITAIWNGFSFLLVVGCMPETLPGSLLKYKAMAWRSLTSSESSGGEKGIRWKAEIEDESFGVALQRNLKRPFIMLVKEPILVFFSVYLTGESSIPLLLSPPCSLPSTLLLTPLHSVTQLFSSLSLAHSLTRSGLYMPIRPIQFLPNSLHLKIPLSNSNRSNFHPSDGWILLIIRFDDLAFRTI
jgi:MFS family permease